jgi:hypothetical protein
MIRTSEQIQELNEAFVRAQAKFEAAVKSNTNPAFKSKYADISSVLDATLEHLNSEGISVRQHPALEYKAIGDGVEAYVTVTTRLAHKSGQWEESDLSMPAIQRDRFDAQSCGSALTYACRYALQGILCVRREDDDGNQAVGRGSREAATQVAQEKIKDLKAKMEAAPAQLCCYPSRGNFEVTGMADVMNQHKELLLAFGKVTSKNPPIVTMTPEGLDAFKHEFAEIRKGILVMLKSSQDAAAARELAAQ